MGDLISRDFRHPYQPYDIQQDLMNAIYGCIEEGKIGIFESPTGTGKSLSLICSSLTWLRNFQDRPDGFQAVEQDDEDEPSWVREHMRDQQKRAGIQQKAKIEARLKQIRAKELSQKKDYEHNEITRKRFVSTFEPEGNQLLNSTQKPSKDKLSTDSNDDSRFELQDYNSDDEEAATKASSAPTDQGVSSASLQLMEQLGLVFKSPVEEDLDPIDETKILFCSRTHSQLTQFVHELRRVHLPPPSWLVRAEVLDKVRDEQVLVKHLPLGSRKNLCINHKVATLGNGSAINEHCLELQQPDTPKDHKCPFLPTGENETLVNDFRDHTLAAIRDIEDLGSLGRRIGICPYYASRRSIKPSEVVTLPYPLLLQKSAREALDLSLKGHVVIIDEAHNLMDTISNIHSVSVTHSHLKRCRATIGVYLQKFRNRLKGKNRVYVAQLVRLVDSLLACMNSRVDSKVGSDGLVSIGDLMAGKGVDQINLYKLMQYLTQSKLARKVEGYAEHEEQRKTKEERPNDSKSRSNPMPVLTQVQSFLATLTNPAAEGRFFYEKADNGELSLKYMLLDATHHFREIVEDARAVILAGGTMSPMDGYTRHLFAYVNPDRLMTWSCGHIIPKENLIAMPVANAHDGTVFDFTYEKRNSLNLMTALGDCLVQLAACVPDGMVVFFPSYAYLDQVVSHWKKTRYPNATSKTIWDLISDKKPVFQESKTASVEDTLTSYSLSISTCRGGLLLSVINGKLSEGINFSDDLGRAVIVVGLPFPNIHSAEWRAKLEYIEQSTTKRTGGSLKEGKEASREFYENACMRAVNQSIGRAIRHKGDFAGILLLDRRYAGGSGRIEGKLPGWIRQGLVKQEAGEGLEGVTRRLRTFFDEKRGAGV